uniref:Coiled-coil domain containing 34 n=1 Tax=Pavo cristatus TaxID=9049 RepID=A0A8C9F5G9_PAVCR
LLQINKKWLSKCCERREREQKLSKEMAEKATRELEKIQLQEKAEVKYNEWLKKKRAEESEKKKKEKVIIRTACIIKPVEYIFLFSYRYSLNVLGRPDGNSYPAPAYCNPIPWKPVHIPPPKEESIALTMKNSKRSVSCRSHKFSPTVIYKPKNNLWQKSREQATKGASGGY